MAVRIECGSPMGSARCMRRQNGLLRVAAVERLVAGRPKQAFYSTCHPVTVIDVLRWYAWRWSIGVTFRESKQSFGF